MPRATRDNAVIVAIARDGKVYLGSDPASPEELPGLIRQRMANGAEWKVYLKVDRRAKYGVVASVLAQVRTAGFGNVAILAEQRRGR